MVILFSQALNCPGFAVANIQLAQRLIDNPITSGRQAGPADHFDSHLVWCHIHSKAHRFLHQFFRFDMHRDNASLQTVGVEFVKHTPSPKH